MNSAMERNTKIQEAMELSTRHPEYDLLPESIKMMHTPKQYAWLGEARTRIVERECQPDYDVTE